MIILKESEKPSNQSPTDRILLSIINNLTYQITEIININTREAVQVKRVKIMMTLRSNNTAAR